MASMLTSKFLRAILFLTQLILVIASISAQTPVGGTISVNTTWDTTGTPYILTSDVTVALGVTLTIEPHVEVNFPYLRSLNVNGTLIADGTAQDSIRFYGSDPDPSLHGGRILFNANSENSLLDHVVIEKLGENINVLNHANVIILSSAVTVSNSRISDGERNGVRIDGNVSPNITNNRIENHGNSGIYIPNISQPVIDGNTFVNNTKNILIHPESVGLATITNNNSSIISIIGTTISGTTSWPVSDGIYELDGDITVAAGVTLTLAPGVEVSFPYLRSLNVDGTLIADGTSQDSIRFYGSDPDPNRHGGRILFNANSENSLLDHVIIEKLGDAAGGNDASVAIYSSVTVSNSRISDSELYGIRIDGNVSPLIDRTRIEFNSDGIFYTNSSPNISNCIFRENTIGIHITGGSPTLMLPNIFQDNTSAGIYFQNCVSVVLSNQTYINNIGIYGAIRIQDTQAFTVKHNLFTGNSWPLSMDLNSTSTDSSALPDSGNVNNGIQILGSIGVQPVTWTNIGIAYIIPNTINLEILTIGAGTTLQFNNSRGLIINIQLEAFGTSAEPITFTRRDSTGYWSGIHFQGGSLSYMEYCIVELASTGITATASLLNLSNSTIANNLNQGVVISNPSSTLIIDCIITDNGWRGISCLNGASPNIQFNRIFKNGIGITSQDAQPLVHFNHLYNNSQYDFENLGSQTINAPQNYWGPITTAEMEALPYPSDITAIYDFFDNTTYGMVEYENWLTDVPTILSVSPNNASNYGTSELTIRGNGFEPGADIKISRSGYQDITPIYINYVDSSKILATVDFDGRQLGRWDVVVTNPGEEPLILLDGFIIGEGFVNPWINVLGRRIARIGRPHLIRVIYGNSGNISLNSIVLWIPRPPGISLEINLPQNLHFPDSTSMAEKVSITETDSAAMVIISSLFGGETNSFDIEITNFNTGPTNFSVEVRNPTIFDPFPITAMEWYQPGTEPPRGAIVIRLTRDGGSGHVGIYVGNGEVVELIRNPDNTSIIRKINMSDLWHDGEGGEGQYVGAAIPPGWTFELGNSIADNALIRVGETSNYLVVPLFPNTSNCVNFTDEEYANVGLELNWVPTTSPAAIYEGFFGEVWPETHDGWFLLAPSFWQDELPTIYPHGTVDFNIDFVGSIDPNEKVGLPGYSNNYSIPLTQSLQYIIYFENVDSATAAAQEIEILDTIDTNLDWSTFSFSDLQIANTLISITNGGVNFNQIIPWNDTVEVHIDGTFEVNTGVIRWYIHGTDIRNGDLADFLPPNVNPPEGEGWVSFSVNPKSDLVTGDQIRNKAAIIFDVNPPVITNEFFNTIDAKAPVSQVDTVNDSLKGATFEIAWSGFDDPNGSQIRNYSIYVAEDGGAYNPWLNQVSDTMDIYPGEGNHNYWYYSISRDSVGNLESQPFFPDLNVWNAGYEFLNPGWQLSAISNHPSNDSLSVLFSEAPASYYWNSATQNYISAYTLDITKGYWIAIPDADKVFIAAEPLTEYLRQFPIGWHMVGGVAKQIAFSNPMENPDSAVIATYGWDPATPIIYSSRHLVTKSWLLDCGGRKL
ncbi:MAG: right-handed parallel beta-helix repeat-containing protein [Ignavibacteria bacterium]|nr:right-handed parallel beta-helix repeat-containing protein [Ignavibacteria bacterium]